MLNLNDYQVKKDYYKHILVYMKHIITTNQKFVRDIQETKEGIQTQQYRKPSTYKKRQQENKGGKDRKEPQEHSENDKVAIIVYLSLITLNVNELSAPNKR